MISKTGPPKSIKKGSKMVPFLNPLLRWILVKMGSPKWKLFEHKTRKNTNSRGFRNRSRISSDLESFFGESRALANHKIIENSLVFILFFENHPSCHRLNFGVTFGLQNPSILEPKNHEKPLQDLSRRVPETGSFFYRFLCWFMLILGRPNGFQNQHKIDQKTGSFLDPLKNRFFRILRAKMVLPPLPPTRRRAGV